MKEKFDFMDQSKDRDLFSTQSSLFKNVYGFPLIQDPGDRTLVN